MTRVPVVRNRNPWYEPFDLMNRLFSRWSPVQRQDKEEDDFFAPLLRDFPFDFGGSPAVDVEENDQEIVVRAEMPGMEKDEFSIELEDDTLILRGEKKYQDEHKDRNVHRVECRYGRFDRRITLPTSIQADKASAEYKNGVLNITLPKSETAKRKAIAVHVK